MKKLMLGILTLISLTISSDSFGQNTLDVEKYKDAELFIEKKNYDVQERLKEISEITGKQVTVYIVSKKNYKIKKTYTGIAEPADYPGITDKAKASLFVVKVNLGNGSWSAYFPHTYERRYRIYLTEKMK